MARALLIAIALIYAVLGVWCAADPAGTAQALGFAMARPDARSEWVAVYGGMELGFAAWAAWAALGPAQRAVGALAGFAFIHIGISALRIPGLLLIDGLSVLPFILSGVEIALSAACLLAIRTASAVPRGPASSG